MLKPGDTHLNMSVFVGIYPAAGSGQPPRCCHPPCWCVMLTTRSSAALCRGRQGGAPSPAAGTRCSRPGGGCGAAGGRGGAGSPPARCASCLPAWSRHWWCFMLRRAASSSATEYQVRGCGRIAGAAGTCKEAQSCCVLMIGCLMHPNKHAQLRYQTVAVCAWQGRWICSFCRRQSQRTMRSAASIGCGAGRTSSRARRHC